MATFQHQEFNDLPTTQLGKVYTLISTGFPIYEQRTAEQLGEALSDNRYHFRAYLEDGEVVAILAFWKMPTYVYIEHFAVIDESRGKGVGSQILKSFKEEMKALPVILEIDPLTSDVARKRCEFYTQLGFVLNDFPHKHPAYREIFEPHELTVLSCPEVLSSKLYQVFATDLRKVIVK